MADTKVEATPMKLPEVKGVVDPEQVTKDEECVDVPQPWFLALVTSAMTLMTSMTVSASLFFLLAAPEKVSPHCYEREAITRGFCTASTTAFWTYPVVCCLFVVLLYAKNLIDQRVYYEFLLHRVVIGYGPPSGAIWNPVVMGLLLYAVTAFSALVWYRLSNPAVEVSHIYSCLAYITPIISFLAVIFTSWSIQGKLITLPNFMANFPWAMSHLKECKCFPVQDLHKGYNCLEKEVEKTEDTFDTPHLVALVQHYTTTVQIATPREDEDKDGEKAPLLQAMENRDLSAAEHALVADVVKQKEWIYWMFRMLFNPRLQDERSQAFRNWTIAFMVGVVLAVLLCIHIFVCCLVTCLEIERVLTPDMVAWGYTHGFSLRPDLGGESNTKSLKQVAASVAMSALQTGARSFNKPQVGFLHFQIGAAAA